MSNASQSYASLNLLRDFPEIVERYLRHKEHKALDRNRNILFHRYGLVDGNDYTLQELATYYDLSRQRVSQVESRIVGNLRKLLTGTLRARGWGIEPQYLEQFAGLKAGLGERGPLFTRPRIQQAIQQHLGRHGLAARLPEGWLSIFLEVLDYERLAPSLHKHVIPDQQEIWVRREALSAGDCKRMFGILEQVRREVEGRPIFRIASQATQASGRSVDERLVRAFAGVCQGLEETPDQRIRPRFSAISSGADRAWRVLFETGRPMHYSDLAREINHREAQAGGRKILAVRNVTNQMHADDRFAAVGRSGLWSLTEWEGVETGTIIQAMVWVLHRSGKPVPLKRLISEVLKRRSDADEKSVKIYASEKQEIFCIAQGNLVALKVWKMPEAARRRSRRIDPEKFLETVREVARGQRQIKLKGLAETLAERLDACDRVCRQWIDKLDGLERTKNHGSRSMTIHFEPERIAFRQSCAQTTLRDRIQAEIRRCRARYDTHGMTKKELHKLVNRAVPCRLPTFYAYLSELDRAEAEVEQEPPAPQRGRPGRAPAFQRFKGPFQQEAQ